MLGKTMKYEFKATARTFLPTYAVLLAVSVLTRLASNFNGMSASFLFILLAVLVGVAFAAVGVITVVLIIYRFQTNLLSREGYLMHTLPVKPWQHIMAKLLTSTVWCLCSLIVCVAAIAILAAVPMREVFGDSFFSDMKLVFQRMDELGIKGSAIRFGVQLIVMSLLSCFSFILCAYLALSIGQLANKHRIWASVGAYIGINTVTSYVSSRIGISLSINHLLAPARWTYAETLDFLNSGMLLGIALSLVFSVIFFFLTEMILRKKLNLK